MTATLSAAAIAAMLLSGLVIYYASHELEQQKYETTACYALLNEAGD